MATKIPRWQSWLRSPLDYSHEHRKQKVKVKTSYLELPSSGSIFSIPPLSPYRFPMWLERLIELLRERVEERCIYVITHDRELGSEFENFIMVNKNEERVSRIGTVGAWSGQ